MNDLKKDYRELMQELVLSVWLQVMTCGVNINIWCKPQSQWHKCQHTCPSEEDISHFQASASMRKAVFFALYSEKLVILKLLYRRRTSHQSALDSACFWNVNLISSKYCYLSCYFILGMENKIHRWTMIIHYRETGFMFKALLSRLNLLYSIEEIDI